ncbi:MAG: winged helix-turn-helix domain-containing protein [Thermoplasmata archaeon]
MNKTPSMDRPDLYVIARLLEKLWREEKPMLRTRLQVAANVNYDIFRRYLVWMAERRLVEVQSFDDGYERVVLTAEGMEAYKRLVQWINEMILGGSGYQ